MEAEKTYEYTAKYTKKDGTVVEYKTKKKYVKKGKEVKKGDVITLIKFIDDQQQLKQIKEFVENLRQNGGGNGTNKLQ
jgi:hypothetical protein